MNIEDLRIGNYLNHSEFGLVKVYGLNPECIQYIFKDTVYLEEDLSKFKPIPLTEELLLKCGFVREQDTADDVEIEMLSGMSGKAILKLKNGGWQFGYGYQDYCKDVEYLHQVQNLFFYVHDEQLNPQL